MAAYTVAQSLWHISDSTVNGALIYNIQMCRYQHAYECCYHYCHAGFQDLVTACDDGDDGLCVMVQVF